ncbi:hypothetical protein ASPCAL08204 [Aspergillus calidoustus]|uniref:BZIP domain-containing protein n=1 Tax=Aspergillus calidoustus TaxID=454130 RepID=A0A0U5CQ68_ASPCI|nr:hypothetical protein ASPCAL08204 [Aspergillus calidoustus]
MKPRSKRAGRPRLAADSDAVLSTDRRAQVRRAQKTYRQRKEAVFRDATARAERLEARMRSAREEMIGLAEVAREAQLNLSHPDIHARLMRLEQIISGSDELIEASPGLSSPQPRTQSQTQSPTRFDLDPQLSLPMQQHTYAFQEPRLARQLQRYSLEHAYRLFTQSHSDPREMHRVFRLVPCVREPSKTEPRFRQLLMGGCTDSLELFGLPFYGVGGAGAHFPDVDAEGNPVFPVNRRMPRRILGIVPGAGAGDGDGRDGEREQALVAYGLGGEWFDCRDVEGYLREEGVDVNGGLFPVQHIPSRADDVDCKDQSRILDVEGFFSRLLSGLVILGRAPGFRKSDVRRALQASIKTVGCM